MKKGTKNVLRVVISIVYIVWGIFSPISAIKAVLALNIGAIASAAVGVLMLLAGLFGLIGVKKKTCRIFGIVLFVLSVAAVVLALPTISVNSIVTAILSWLMVVGNIPLLYCLNRDWYDALMNTVFGKIVLAISGVVIIITAIRMNKITKPIEYKR